MTMQQLSGLDASFLTLETENAPMHIGGVSIVGPDTPEGPLDLDMLRRLMAERLHVARTFTEKLADVPLKLGKPYWVPDEDFDLDRHISRTQLPEPGGVRELAALASWEFAQQLPRDRPLWDLLLVEGVDGIEGIPPGSKAVISKVHHAAIDGVSGSQIMQALYDPRPRVPAVAPEGVSPPAAAAVATPGAGALLRETGKRLLTTPAALGKTLGETVRSAVRTGAARALGKVELPPMPFTAPRTRWNGRVGRERSWHAVRLELDTVKALRSAVDGATVNDVVLAVCAGALRRFLLEHDELPEDPLVAMVPVSVRQAEEDGTQGNKVSAMLVALATDVEDPIERLRTIHHNTRRAKIYQQAVGANTLADATEFVPFGLAGVAARLYTRFHLAERHRPLFNLVITNVPGPQIPLYVAGAPLLAHFGTAPVFDGMGLMLPVFSYAGKIGIGVTTCRSMGEASQLSQAIRDSLDALEAVVNG